MTYLHFTWRDWWKNCHVPLIFSILLIDFSDSTTFTVTKTINYVSFFEGTEGRCPRNVINDRPNFKEIVLTLHLLFIFESLVDINPYPWKSFICVIIQTTIVCYWLYWRCTLSSRRWIINIDLYFNGFKKDPHLFFSHSFENMKWFIILKSLLLGY